MFINVVIKVKYISVVVVICNMCFLCLVLLLEVLINVCLLFDKLNIGFLIRFCVFCSGLFWVNKKLLCFCLSSYCLVVSCMWF